MVPLVAAPGRWDLAVVRKDLPSPVVAVLCWCLPGPLTVGRYPHVECLISRDKWMAMAEGTSA